MKFYAAMDSIGQTILCGTQAEARLIDKKFTAFDIPTDKEGLMAFAQSALTAIFEAKQGQTTIPPMEEFQAPPQTPKLSQQVAVLQDVAITALMIEDFVLYKATMGQIEAIFACLGNRFKEMARGVQDNAQSDSA